MKKRPGKKSTQVLNGSLPIAVMPSFLGKAQELSVESLKLMFEHPMLLSKVLGNIALSDKETVKKEFSVVWSKHLIEHKGLKYVPAFIRLREKDLELLIDATFKTYKLNQDFVRLTKQLAKYLEGVKEDCDRYDREHPLINDQLIGQELQYIEEHKGDIFRRIDRFFQNVWEFVRQLDPAAVQEHQRFFQFMLERYLGTPSVINKRICEKPFGYSGDFVTMTLIYDYHKGSYLGESTYAKLINHYTCNVPVSCSNIIRKDYLKGQILRTIRNNDNPTILSVGCGPARELVEILRDVLVKRPFRFLLLDFEPRALEYARREIERLHPDPKLMKIEFIQTDIRDLIKNRDAKHRMQNVDLIYLSGVFDYLKDKICGRIVSGLYPLIKSGGRLITCNISLESDYHRAYYEMFGDWDMYHRNEQDVLSWVADSKDFPGMTRELVRCGNYLVLVMDKQ